MYVAIRKGYSMNGCDMGLILCISMIYLHRKTSKEKQNYNLFDQLSCIQVSRIWIFPESIHKGATINYERIRRKKKTSIKSFLAKVFLMYVKYALDVH